MKAFCICLALLLAAGTASAQMYRWVDKDGKVRYGDTPPPGAKTTPIKAPTSGSAAPAAASKDGKDAKDAKKGPMTAAEREQDYRKRQEESRKSTEKAEAESRAKTDNSERCARTKEYLRTLESGRRIGRTDAAGERYFLDEAQTAQEVEKAKQTMAQVCDK